LHCFLQLNKAMHSRTRLAFVRDLFRLLDLWLKAGGSYQIQTAIAFIMRGTVKRERRCSCRLGFRAFPRRCFGGPCLATGTSSAHQNSSFGSQKSRTLRLAVRVGYYSCHPRAFVAQLDMARRVECAPSTLGRARLTLWLLFFWAHTTEKPTGHAMSTRARLKPELPTSWNSNFSASRRFSSFRLGDDGVVRALHGPSRRHDQGMIERGPGRPAVKRIVSVAGRLVGGGAVIVSFGASRPWMLIGP